MSLTTTEAGRGAALAAASGGRPRAASACPSGVGRSQRCRRGGAVISATVVATRADSACDPIASLRDAVVAAARTLADGELPRLPTLDRPPKLELGDFATNAAMLLAPLARSAPREVAPRLAAALADAHALGIVHRDLKPENIVVGRARDGSDLVKVVDFGIAKAVTGDRQQVTRTGFVLGTPDYMSPEQLAGEPLDGRSDQYALALVAFQMLTGKLPFAGRTEHEAMLKRLTAQPQKLAEARPDVLWPPGLQEVFDRALSRRPEDRFPSVTDFAEALARAYGFVTPAAGGEAAGRRSSRRATSGVIVGAVVGLVAASAAMVTITWRLVARHSPPAMAAESARVDRPSGAQPTGPAVSTRTAAAPGEGATRVSSAGDRKSVV